MNKFKFRVWDIKNKKMFYPDLIAISRIGAVRIDYNINFLPGDSGIQQFTGLQSETGRDIYEGDILNSKACRYKVIWEDGCWKAESIMGINVGNKRLLNDVKDYSFIIGNIFENPELLTS